MSTVSVTPRGLILGRYCKALLVAGGDPVGAHAFAMGQGAGWREVAESLKAVIAPMDAATEAGGLAFPIAFDFAQALRPATLLGRMVGVRPVPFNTRLIAAASGAAASWVGEGTPVPAGKLDLDGGTTLAFNKIQSMSVHTQELARVASPSAESVIAADAIRAAALAADVALVDPDNAGSAHRPASITHGATAVASTGSGIAEIDADLEQVVGALTDANVDLTSAAWLMNPRTATHMALLRGTGGAAAYPGLGPRGGRLLEMPVLTSAAIADASSPTECPIVLVACDELLLADDGAARVSISEQASIEMDDAPGAGAQALVSLWQHGLAALVAERVICWKLRRSAACAYVSGVQF